VQQFEAALHKASCPNGLVWVDVACIDQENQSVKMDEIGNQASIFRHAQRVCVWLTSLHTATMQSSLEELDSFARKVELDLITYRPNSLSVGDVRSLLSQNALLYKAEDSLAILLRDPWFSSLWTLQEACLSETAVLLSSSAESAPFNRPLYKPTKERDLFALVGDCIELKMGLLPHKDADASVNRILEAIERSGLSSCQSSGFDNPSTMLYSAASYRTTTDPLDRVYGVMQVYGLRLGASAQPGVTFTLPELEDQLGTALNRMSPIAAQLHIHTRTQTPDRAWRVSQHAFLPDIYSFCAVQNSKCDIYTTIDGRPRLRGQACSIDSLTMFWTTENERRHQQFLSWEKALPSYIYHYQANLHLDATDHSDVRHSHVADIPRVGCPCSTCIAASCTGKALPGSVTQAFLREFPAPLSAYMVLHLGDITLFRITGPRQSWTVAARAGMLVRREDYDGKSFWKRVGICSWEKNEAVSFEEPDREGLWSAFDDFIG
jgi:hypothetical protein